MKKTSVISISIILLALYSLQSCRQDNMDTVPENNSLVEKEHQQKLSLKSTHDSLATTSELQFDENGHEIADPPPKDKDQWRY